MSVSTRLGRYPVRRRIGSGAFATVWLAYDEQLDSPVAIKVLADNWTEDSHARQRFVEEGRFLRKVESPHVVSVYDAGELEDSRPFLVMSYADQGSLEERLEAEPLTVSQAMHVIRQVGAGLGALHEQGVLHRDVKPANVLFRTVERSGVPEVSAMLGDLGLGKAMDMSSRLTLIGGTPSYASPEQAQGEPLDARSDQFSLAALAYLLLAGRPPYAHTSLKAAADPAPPAPLGDDLPAETEAVLLRALSTDRESRYADVLAFVDALGASLADVAGDVAETPTWIPVDPELTRPSPDDEAFTMLGSGAQVEAPRMSRSRLALLGAAAAVVGLGGGVVAHGLIVNERTIVDESRVLSVTVPKAWTAAVDTQRWVPPDSENDEAALSAGTSAEWFGNANPGEGIFMGLVPGDEFGDVPQHPECDPPRPAEDDVNADGDAYRTVEFRGCDFGGVTIEQVVQVQTNKLLWVQIRADDRAAANEVLDSIETSGI